LADLITPTLLYNALNVAPGDLSPQEVDKYAEAIAAASAAVRAWTDRNFEAATGTATTRTFEYDGSGVLEIDDCTSVTGVAVTVPNGVDRSLTPVEFSPRPFEGPIFDYITMSPSWGQISREMGFTRNLDRYEGPLGYQPTIKVTATWGWPEIPADVRRAVIWTAVALVENPRPFISESIEGYSRTIGPAPFDAIPQRAAALLAPYTKIKV
jgi:hypothetical protein